MGAGEENVLEEDIHAEIPGRLLASDPKRVGGACSQCLLAVQASPQSPEQFSDAARLLQTTREQEGKGVPLETPFEAQRALDQLHSRVMDLCLKANFASAASILSQNLSSAMEACVRRGLGP